MKTKIYLMLIFNFYYISCCMGEASLPPRKNEILEKVNHLWLNRDFDELDNYVEKLTEQFPGYLPVRFLKAEWALKKNGNDLIAYITEMTDIEKTLQNYLPYVSPVLLEFIKGRINISEKSIVRQKNKGWTRQYKYDHFAPENLKSLDEWSRLDFLYIFSPEISIPDKPGGKVVIHYKQVPTTKAMNKEETMELIADKKQRDTMKRADAIRYLEQQHPGDNLSFLSHWMKSFFPEISCAAAEAVAGYGEEAIPVALDIARSPGQFYIPAIPSAIWVLLQVGPNEPETWHILYKLKDKHHPKSETGIYINRAIRYIEDNYEKPQG